jgi:hypothetical protein
MIFTGDNETFTIGAGAVATIAGSNDTILYGQGASISLVGNYSNDTFSPLVAGSPGATFLLSANDTGIVVNGGGG